MAAAAVTGSGRGLASKTVSRPPPRPADGQRCQASRQWSHWKPGAGTVFADVPDVVELLRNRQVRRELLLGS
ncbi:hypothetical protein L3i22_034880 [Actinoplanes sp. L3-i22]|nr:hypothetical protein L3i22_034880 [Actinoplanes sp. L3-i22]